MPKGEEFEPNRYIPRGYKDFDGNGGFSPECLARMERTQRMLEPLKPFEWTTDDLTWLRICRIKVN